MVVYNTIQGFIQDICWKGGGGGWGTFRITNQPAPRLQKISTTTCTAAALILNLVGLTAFM